MSVISCSVSFDTGMELASIKEAYSFTFVATIIV